jgi:2-(1,2-epoxy-1,2-dihydrophenyl)acetyl-CoA isomerase
MIDTVREHGVLRLHLNRPTRLNALTLAVARDLLVAVREADADPQTRALLLTAEGASFCAGKDRDDPATAEFVDVLQQLAAALMGTPKPVVAAVQGWVVGAGVELLLNCDLAVAARDARFMLPEVNVGLFGTGGVLGLLPRTIGLAKAKGALMLGQPISAVDAERWGLLWALADDAAAARTQADGIARQLAAASPQILGEIKRSLHHESFGNLGAILAREAAVHGRLGVP